MGARVRAGRPPGHGRSQGLSRVFSRGACPRRLRPGRPDVGRASPKAHGAVEVLRLCTLGAVEAMAGRGAAPVNFPVRQTPRFRASRRASVRSDSPTRRAPPGTLPIRHAGGPCQGSEVPTGRRVRQRASGMPGRSRAEGSAAGSGEQESAPPRRSEGDPAAHVEANEGRRRATHRRDMRRRHPMCAPFAHAVERFERRQT